MDKIFSQREHYGRVVTGFAELEGKHREYCICYHCNQFIPDVPDLNCPIARALFELDRLVGIVTPVWECPEFELKQK